LDRKIAALDDGAPDRRPPNALFFATDPPFPRRIAGLTEASSPEGKLRS
jgi:hypothetical protein